MRGLFSLVFVAAASLVTQTLATPIVVTPGDAGDLIITEDNTINGTHVPDHATQEEAEDESNQRIASLASETTSPNEEVALQTQNLRFALHNQFGGGALNASVTGLAPTGAIVMLGRDGQWYHPNPAGSTTPVPIQGDVAIPLNPQGQITEFSLPDYISSGRVWVAEGNLQFFTVQGPNGPQLIEPSAVNPSDPSAAINWGFVELTNTRDGGIYANISFVDFVGLPIAMNLTLASGEEQSVIGLRSNAVGEICQGLRDQTAQDGQPWDQMCVTGPNGNPLRVLAPNIYTDINPGSMDGYYADYINQVWDRYRNQDLIINTQAQAGRVACRVQGDELQCAGDNRGYARPNVQDIWGCNTGPFAINRDSDNAVHYAVVPRLCAAFHRTTLLMDGGDVQPSLGRDSYYMNNPTSHYSRLVHAFEVDGRGYSFSYDDVNPDGQNEAGVVAGPNPQLLELIIGGFQ